MIIKNETMEVVEELKERIKSYTHETELKILENANLIVEIGALTVGTDLNGKVIPQNVLYPTQFTKKAVKAILSMDWRNGKGERIEPVVFNRNDWYRERLKIMNSLLKILEAGY